MILVAMPFTAICHAAHARSNWVAVCSTESSWYRKSDP